MTVRTELERLDDVPMLRAFCGICEKEDMKKISLKKNIQILNKVKPLKIGPQTYY